MQNKLKEVWSKIAKCIKKWKYYILIIMLAPCLMYFLNEDFKEYINKIVYLLKEIDTQVVVDYIQGFGMYGMIVSFLLMVLQSVIAPLPAIFITCANAMIWGWAFGALLSWTSAMVGALLCFYIARAVGRKGITKYMPESMVEVTDGYFEKYGKHTILLCRLLPFISFDFVSYGAGLTSMSLTSFLIATGIGQLPATIIYSYIAAMAV